MFRTRKKRGWRFWLATGFAGLLLLVAMATLYLASRSDDWWQENLAAALSRVLEREVVIEGDLRLDMARHFRIEVEDLRIANPGWSQRRDFLRVGELRLEFDLLSLLGDTLLIRRLHLADLRLDLEQDGEGRKNWAFFPAKTSSSQRSTPPASLALPVHVDDLTMDNIHLRLETPELERPAELTISQLRGGQSPADDLEVEARGELGKVPFTLRGRLGKVTSILAAGPADFELDMKLGETRLQGKGEVPSLAAPLRPQMQLSLQGREAADLTGMVGLPTITKGPFKASIDMQSGNKGVTSRIRGRFGELEIAADLSALDPLSLEDIDIKASLSGKELASFTRLLDIPPLPSGRFSLTADVRRHQGETRIDDLAARIGEHQLDVRGALGDWPALKGTRLHITAAGPDLAVFSPHVAGIGLAQLPKGAYSLDARLESGSKGLQVQPSRLDVADYHVSAQGLIRTRGKLRAELQVEGSGPDLSMITRLVDILALPPWPFQVRGRIDITASDITLVDAHGTAGEHKVAADGPIAFSPNGPLALKVKVGGPSLQALLAGLDIDVIPAAAPYAVEGRIDYADGELRVDASQARLGPATASGRLTMADVTTPTNMAIEVRQLTATDTSKALALVGIGYNFPQAVRTELKGRVERQRGRTRLAGLRGHIGTARVNIDGTVGDPPDYERTRVELDIRGDNFEYFLRHPVKQPIPFVVEGKVGKERGTLHFDGLKLVLADFQAGMDGRIGDWRHIDKTGLDIQARGPHLDVIAEVLDRPLPRGKIDIQARIRGDKETYHVDGLNVQLGRNRLDGQLALTQGEPPLLKGRLHSDFLDFALFRDEKETPAKPAPGKPAVAGKESGHSGMEPSEDDEEDFAAPAQRLFPDTPIELPLMDKVDLDLDVRIDELGNFSEQGALQDLAATISLHDRNFAISEFSGSGAFDSRLEGNLDVRHDPAMTRVKLKLTGRNLRLGLTADPGQDPSTYPPTDMDIRLSGGGRTYHELATSLDGKIRVVQGEGQVSNSNISLILSDMLYEVFLALNPFTKSEPTTRLDCGVYIVRFGNARAEIQDFVFQTDKLTILSAGTIDLDTEAIDVGFTTRPRKGLGISASIITNPYIKIGGTLAEPALVLDPERAAIATGAAVATGGLSFLFKGVWDRYLSSRDPCGDALKKDAQPTGPATGKAKTGKPAYSDDEEDSDW